MKRKPSYHELLVRIKELEKKIQEKDEPCTTPPPSLDDSATHSLPTTKRELVDQLRFIKTLFDTIPNPVFYKNKEGIYLGCNQSFSTQILGIPPERIIGRSLYDLPDVIPKEQADIYRKQDLELIRNPGLQLYETKVRCTGGIFRDFLFYKATYTDHSGDVAGILGLMLDITERNKGQLALKESEEKYRSMMESINDGLYICSPEYRISYMNPKMIERVGYDGTGLLCHNILHNLESPCAWCTFATVRRGEITEVEVLSPKDGHTYIVTNSPIFHQDGSISKMTIYRDITQRKRMEKELLMAKKIEAAGIFAGGIAHDYNNLLFIILGNILMLKKDIPKSSEPCKLLQIAEDAAQKAAKLTKRLLVFTHGESLALEGHAIDGMLKDIICGMDVEKKYCIELQLSDELQMVYVDVSLISIVMINIITNAKEAMEDGGRIIITAANIRLDTNSEQVVSALIDNSGNYVCITVSDNGSGIDKEILPKIFDPYFSTKQRGAKKGLGLGLSTSYSIIRKHSGAILVESEKGVGTTVSIYLPANSPVTFPVSSE